MALQTIFDKIYSDPRVINEYARIEKKDATSSEGYATHDLSHINRVIGYSEKVAKLLGLDCEKISEIKIAALLHDVGCASGGKGGHAARSYEWAKECLSQFEIDKDVQNSILAAIKEHSGNATGLCGKIITFADKIDINKDRILPLGLTIDGNKEYAHLLSVDISIENNYLLVNFVSDGKLNFKAMNEYYFTDKVFEAIEDLATYFNLLYSVFIDGKNLRK